MKQHITVEQLKELSLVDNTTLERWAEKHYDSISCIYANIDGIIGPLLSIGQMIEFLDDSNIELINFSHETWGVEISNGNAYEDVELCDALWEAVKGVLNEKN